jgi:putative phosphoesterase
VKLGVVSDVHNNVEALEYALEHLRSCDAVLSLGDLVSEYRVAPEIIRLARSANLMGIRGNHEKTILMHPGSTLRERLDPDDLAYLAALPARRELHIDGRTVTVAHGSPWDDPLDYHCEYVFPRDTATLARVWTWPSDVILLGHTHVSMALEANHRLILNPGSCGEARDVAGRLTFAELDFGTSTATISVIKFGAPPEPLVTATF